MGAAAASPCLWRCPCHTRPLGASPIGPVGCWPSVPPAPCSPAGQQLNATADSSRGWLDQLQHFIKASFLHDEELAQEYGTNRAEYWVRRRGHRCAPPRALQAATRPRLTQHQPRRQPAPRPPAHLPTTQAELSKLILKRFLLLVLLLDTVNSQAQLPRHAPLLFRIDAQIKSSAAAVQAFTHQRLQGEGNVLRHLELLGYRLGYAQSPLTE